MVIVAVVVGFQRCMICRTCQAVRRNVPFASVAVSAMQDDEVEGHFEPFYEVGVVVSMLSLCVLVCCHA